jgi:hypothetical protein
VGELDESFAQLLGRQPTDKERQNLYRVRDALKIRPTDALWALLMALEHYQTLYEKVPARIVDAVQTVTKAARETAEAQAKTAQEETKRTLMEAVRHAAVVSAKQAAGAQVVKWVGILATAIVAFVVTVGLLAFAKGEAKGDARGENRAKKECGYVAAAATWASTPEGQLAYGLAAAGSLSELGRCSGRGWASKDGWCFAQPERGKTTLRWRLPASGADR